MIIFIKVLKFNFKNILMIIYTGEKCEMWNVKNHKKSQKAGAAVAAAKTSRKQ